MFPHPSALLTVAGTPAGPSEPAWSGAPGYIGNGGQVTSTTKAPFLTANVPYPATISYNDILLMHIVVIETASGTPSITTPSGWTLLKSGTIVLTGFQRFIFWKRATGSETGSETVSLTSGVGDGMSAVMSNWRGCLSSGTPYEGLGSTGGTSASTTGASVTTTGADRLVLNLISKQTTSNTTSTPGSGFTERYDMAFADGTGSATALDDKVQASAATVSGDAATGSGSTRYACDSFALLPR